MLLGVPTHESSAKAEPWPIICLTLSMVRWGRSRRPPCELQGAAMHAAACVDLGDGRLGALAQVGAKTGQRAAEGGRTADGERLAADAALLGKGIAQGRRGRKGSCGGRQRQTGDVARKRLRI